MAIELKQTQTVLLDGVAAGSHVGAQGYVSQNGHALAEFAVGEARPGVAMTPDTLMIWLSSGKPVTAVAVAQLWERGLLRLDDPVVRHLPAFAAGGKAAITLRHLLTHTAGIRNAASNFSRDPWDVTIAKICAAPIEPGWVPGEKAGYHVASSWFILGELVRVLDGRPLERYVQEEIFLPLGMIDCWMALPTQQYAAYGDRIGVMQNTARPADLRHATGNYAVRPHGWDTPEAAAMCKPGANARGPMRQLGRFYEMLLAGGTLGGVRILSPQTVEAMTARHRVGMFDHSFKHVIDFGLGLVLNSNQYGIDTVQYGYGPYAGWRAYGHSGNQSSVAFADPKHGLVAAFVFNGTAGDAAHDRRVRNVLSTLYRELALVPAPGTPGEGTRRAVNC